MHPIYPVGDDGLVRIRPIGRVRSPAREQRTGGFRDLEGELILEPQFEPLLEGLDDFSHLIVVYWLSGIREYSVCRRPQGRDDVPAVGMLASR
jgi:tRNA (Thr-GGU) A37 N-methylase